MPLPDPITFRYAPPPPAVAAGLSTGPRNRAEPALHFCFAGLLAGLLVWTGQHFSVTPWQGWTAYLVLPPAAAAGIGLILLPEVPHPCRRRTPLRLTSALVLAGLSPFIVWWFRMPGQIYFTVCAHAAMLAAGWFLFECAGWLHAFFAGRHRPLLAACAWFTQFLSYFGFILIVAVVPILYLLRCAILWWKEMHGEAGTVMDAWARLSEPTIRTAMLLPGLSLLILLFLARIMPARPPPVLSALSNHEPLPASPIKETEAP